jgi:vacuolar-type H+-ATPase subunit I/STV1
MNTKQILEQLNDAANSLDKQGLHSEASILTDIMIKVAQQPGQSNLNTLYNNYQQNPQARQPYQAPQQPQQQQPRQQAGRQLTPTEEYELDWKKSQQSDQSNFANYKSLNDQCHNLINQIYNNFEKLSPIFQEVRNKIDSGMPLQQTQNGFNSILMCNNILNHTKTLNAQYKNLVPQLQKLANPNNQFDQSTVNHHQKYLKKIQDAIYMWSEIVNKYNLKIKQYQSKQTQQPAQQQKPVQTPQ